MSIRQTLFVTAAWLPLLGASLAMADVPASEVHVEARIVEVSAEVLAGLGVAFNPLDATYSSTGPQEPADTARTPTSGSGGGGVNLMATLFPDGKGLFGFGPTQLGIGVYAEGFYESEESIFALDRHPPGAEDNTMFGKRDIESAVDLAASVRIPLVVVPQVTGENIVIALQPMVGVTFNDVTTSLRSNQMFFLGPDLRESESETETGVLAGIGVVAELSKTKLPLLGDIPVLGGLFYKARRIPGNSVEVTSPFDFTEQFSVDDSWQHSVSLVIILRANIIPFGDDD